MIKNIGTDLVEIDRIARVYESYGDKFLNRLFTARERDYFNQWRDPVPRIAGRFAAKEAAMKALGTGWTGGVRWRDIEIIRMSGGKPTIWFYGRCRELFVSLGAEHIHCTISHSRNSAIAVVIFE